MAAVAVLSFGCSGSPRPAGSICLPGGEPDLLRCFCEDGVVIDTRADFNCPFDSRLIDPVCESYCSTRGGVFAAGCADDFPFCAPPPDQHHRLDCLCVDGRTVELCAPVDCSGQFAGVFTEYLCTDVCGGRLAIRGIGCSPTVCN